MKSILIKINILFAILFLMSGCVADQTYDASLEKITTYNLTPNLSVASLIAASGGFSPATPYANDDVIEAYVTSSDETGNFFTTICFQTLSVAGAKPQGFSVSADFKSFGYGFTPGRKVFIKLKGLHLAQVDGALKIGALYQGGIGRIANFNWDKHLFPSDIIISEDNLVTTTTVDLLNDNSNLNILTEIDNVRFSDSALSRTLFDIDSGGGATNQVLVGIGTTKTTVLRTSSFSTFARATVPAGQGKIRGILTKFGSTFQFYIRNTSDLKLNTTRSYNYVSTLNEGFQSFTNAQLIFPNYINLNPVGTKNWNIRGTNHLEMSSFFGAAEDSKSYFLIPVDMSAASTFDFKLKIQFFTNRTGLTVYRTMDYVPGMKITDATLINISSSFNIPSANTTNFANVGPYNIPVSVTGNGYFVFEYSGTNRIDRQAITTTVQIDDIVIN